jgi:hypothetical protein
MEVVGPLAINPGGTFLVMFDLDARGAPLLRCYDKRSGAQIHEFPLSRMLRGRGAPPAVIKAYTGLAAGDRFILAAGEYVLALVSTDPPPDR